MTLVPRTCTELVVEKRTDGSLSAPRKPLSAFRECSAYVLLGDPGMGKSRALENEAVELGDQGLLVSASDIAGSAT